MKPCGKKKCCIMKPCGKKKGCIMKPCGKKKCYFCGCTTHLETHHIIQKRFQHHYEANIHDPSNLVWLCPSCHRKLHVINNVLLDFLKNVDYMMQSKELVASKKLPLNGELAEWFITITC